MPAERISKEFKDVSLTMKINPINFDLLALKNETAIARSIRNLVMTYPGERFFDPSLGSRISRSLFENMDSITANTIEEEISYTIKRYEPRVELKSVKAFANYDVNTFDVEIVYKIVGIDVPPQKLSFALQPTR